jgi:hypothetical protein
MASQLITVLAPPSSSPPHATSVSRTVTVPNPTPLSEALKDEVVDPPPDIDVPAMIKLLEPIAETLNEAAEEAKYPTPPINTPNVASPAASVVHRHPRPRTRSHGISTISDRLARAKIDIRRYTHHDCDVFSNSEHSILTSSTVGDDNDSVSDVLSEEDRDRHESKSAHSHHCQFRSSNMLSSRSHRLAPGPSHWPRLLHIQRPGRQISSPIQQRRHRGGLYCNSRHSRWLRKSEPRQCG